MKRRFGLFAAILVIAVEMMMPSVCAGQELCPNSKAAVLIDVASGRIFIKRI